MLDELIAVAGISRDYLYAVGNGIGLVGLALRIELHHGHCLVVYDALVGGVVLVVLVDVDCRESRAVESIRAYILNGSGDIHLADIETVESLVYDSARTLLDVELVAIGVALVADYGSAAVEHAVGLVLIPLGILEHPLGIVIACYLFVLYPITYCGIPVTAAVLLDAAYGGDPAVELYGLERLTALEAPAGECGVLTEFHARHL